MFLFVVSRVHPITLLVNPTCENCWIYSGRRSGDAPERQEPRTKDVGNGIHLPDSSACPTESIGRVMAHYIPTTSLMQNLYVELWVVLFQAGLWCIINMYMYDSLYSNQVFDIESVRRGTSPRIPNTSSMQNQRVAYNSLYFQHVFDV